MIEPPVGGLRILRMCIQATWPVIAAEFWTVPLENCMQHGHLILVYLRRIQMIGMHN